MIPGTRECQASPDLRDHLASPDPRGLQDPLDHVVFRDTPVLRVPPETQERRETVVSREPQAAKVSPDRPSSPPRPRRTSLITQELPPNGQTTRERK